MARLLLGLLVCLALGVFAATGQIVSIDASYETRLAGLFVAKDAAAHPAAAHIFMTSEQDTEVSFDVTRKGSESILSLQIKAPGETAEYRQHQRIENYNVTFVRIGLESRWYVFNSTMMVVLPQSPEGPMTGLPIAVYHADGDAELPETDLLVRFLKDYGQHVVDMSLHLAAHNKEYNKNMAGYIFHLGQMTAKAMGDNLKMDDKLIAKIGALDSQCPAASNCVHGNAYTMLKCPPPYERCGNKCFGRCGPNCNCWSWVCGDCDCHRGCEYHDYYCSCKSMLHPYCVAFVIKGGCACCNR